MAPGTRRSVYGKPAKTIGFTLFSVVGRRRGCPWAALGYPWSALWGIGDLPCALQRALKGPWSHPGWPCVRLGDPSGGFRRPPERSGRAWERPREGPVRPMGPPGRPLGVFGKPQDAFMLKNLWFLNDSGPLWRRVMESWIRKIVIISSVLVFYGKYEWCANGTDDWGKRSARVASA